MASLEAALTAVKAAGLLVVVAGEHDDGKWIVSLATSRHALLKTWVAGRGHSFELALGDAMKKRQRPKPPKAAVKSDEFEDILG